jgi:RND family efflux transporter MFP subunit
MSGSSRVRSQAILPPPALAWVAAGAMAGLLLLSGCDDGQQAAGPAGGPQAQKPPPVDVAAPLVKPIIEWDEYTGRFEATERVELRSRVSGYLHVIHFNDGDLVEKGDKLFTIDQRPFRAELARARATAASAEARVELAERDLSRAEKLARSGTTSQETLDSRRSSVAAARGDLAATRATVTLAELELGFTEITSPITGRISDRRIDVGNLVSGGSANATLLATIVSLDPIYMTFEASEADYLRYVRLHNNGSRPSSRQSPNPVFARLLDEQGTWPHEGIMDFVDNAFDPGSGTIRGRALIRNGDLLLVPGLFGKLRLPGSGEYDAVLIPDDAVVSDQSNKVVMVVGADGTVVPKPVRLGPIVEGLRVVREGLTADDRVIVAGLQRARPGGKVTPNEVTIEARPENLGASGGSAGSGG